MPTEKTQAQACQTRPSQPCEGPSAHQFRIPTLWAELGGPQKCLCFLYFPTCTKTDLFCGWKPTAPSWHRRTPQLLLLRKTKCNVKVAVPWPSWQCMRCGQRERQISAGIDNLSPAQGQNLTSHQVGGQLIHEVSFRGPPPPPRHRQYLHTEFSICARSGGSAERRSSREIKAGSGFH